MGKQFGQIMAAIGLLTILASSGKKRISCSSLQAIQLEYFIKRAPRLNHYIIKSKRGEHSRGN